MLKSLLLAAVIAGVVPPNNVVPNALPQKPPVAVKADPTPTPPVPVPVPNPAPTLPVVKIGGIDTAYQDGDMVVLTAKVDGRIPDNLAMMKFRWVVLENGVLKTNVVMFPDGSELVFAAKNGRVYVVILDIDCLFMTVDNGVIKNASLNSPDCIIGQITVGNPGPNPTPTPTPPPVFPNSKFGLDKFMYDTFAQDTFMTPADKKKLANALIVGLHTVQGQLDDKTITTIANALQAAHTANYNAVVASGIPYEKSANIRKIVGDKFQSLYAARQAVTTDDFAEAFDEMITGLAAVPSN